MALLDRRAQEEGKIPGILLMEDAGQHGWNTFIHHAPELLSPGELSKHTKILFVAGGGNNGGDCLVMARAAWSDGYKDIAVLLLSEKGNESCSLHRDICKSYRIPVLNWLVNPEEAAEAMKEADCIFDGIAGTGLHGPLKEPARSLVKTLNESKARVVAVDTPSGVGEGDWDIAVQADLTLTMELVKYPQLSPEGRKRCGTIAVVPLGFPPHMVSEAEELAEYLSPNDLLPPLPDRYGYKNSRGHLLVLGGSPGTEGALFLSARAAASSGAGLVTAMVDEEILRRSGIETSGIMVRLADLSDLQFADAIVVGPGWGRGESRKRDLQELIKKSKKMVFDADAIALIGSLFHPEMNKPAENPWILTPHPGEASGLLLSLVERGFPSSFPSLLPHVKDAKSGTLEAGVVKNQLLRDPEPLLKELSRFIGGVIVLKSHITHVVSPDGRYHVIEGSNPCMGTGGSGDILSGLCGSFLLRRGLDPFQAAMHAVAAHQRAGLRAALRGWFTAGDLLTEIGSAAMGAES